MSIMDSYGRTEAVGGGSLPIPDYLMDGITMVKMKSIIGICDKPALDRHALSQPVAKEYLMDGITRVKMNPHLRDTLQFLLKFYIRENITAGKAGKDMNHLKCNKSPDRINPLTGIEISGVVDGRTWMQLYPFDRSRYFHQKDSSNKNTVVDIARLVATAVHDSVLPTVTLAQMAVKRRTPPINDYKANYKEIQRNRINHSVRHVKPLEDLLALECVNLLARGGCPVDQSLHMDGTGYRIIAIIPLQHGPLGYQLRYVKRSHRINFQISDGAVDKTILDYIPASIAETLFATRDEMVIFNERLLHAGGFPSTYEDGAERDTSFSSGVKIKKKKEAKEGYCRLKWLCGDLCH